MPPPIGFRWADKEWHLDECGPWMDSVLGIGECDWNLIKQQMIVLKWSKDYETNRIGFTFFTLYSSPSNVHLDHGWNLQL
jgi:hypothetical protein